MLARTRHRRRRRQVEDPQRIFVPASRRGDRVLPNNLYGHLPSNGLHGGRPSGQKPPAYAQFLSADMPWAAGAY